MSTPATQDPLETQIEKLIEKLIDATKRRTLAANIGCAYMGLSLLSAISSVAVISKSYQVYDELNQWAATNPGDPTFQASLNKIQIMNGLYIGALATALLAAFGLYRMRRYGIYAVSGNALLGAAMFAASPGAGLSDFVFSGLLFYFLWNERSKYSVAAPASTP